MSFLDILFSPLVIIAMMVPIMIILGIFIGSYLSSTHKDVVQSIQPETGRGTQYEAKEQDSKNIYCNPMGKEPTKHFIKTGSAINMAMKGFLGRIKHVAVWNGRFGTAYTYPIGEYSETLSLEEAVTRLLGEADYSKIPVEQQNKIESDPKKYQLGGEHVKTYLEETLTHIFGEEEYGLLPQETRNKIKFAEVGVIVDFPSVPLTPEGLSSITDDDVNRDNDQKVMNALVNGIKALGKGGPPLLILMVLPMIGVVIGLALAWVFHIGGQTTTNNYTTAK